MLRWSSRWLGVTLVGAGVLAACGGRSTLSAPSGGGGAGGAPVASSSSSGGSTASTSNVSSTSVSSTSVSSSVSTSVSSSVSTSVSSSVSSTSVSSSVSVSSSSGNPCPPLGCAACSDGTREGFVDAAAYPSIAGCSGGWTVPGLLFPLAPSCGLVSGNSSPNPSGTGCNVADLCAAGSHVCTGPGEVAARSSTGCAGAAAGDGLFFATRQSSNGCDACALGGNQDPTVCDGTTCTAGCAQTALTANDLFGCGSVGTVVSTCATLDRASGNQCSELTGNWSCPDDHHEASTVTKAGSAGGGVLCCSD